MKIQYPIKLSDHFTFAESIESETAERNNIPNLPNEAELAVMVEAAKGMERVRGVLGVAIFVTSWFRSIPVNRILKSKDNSQHPQGEAVDFKAPSFGTPLAICQFLIRYQHIIKFDQLILEHSWVHISFAIRTGEPRGQVLSLLNTGHYAVGLTDKYGKPYN